MQPKRSIASSDDRHAVRRVARDLRFLRRSATSRTSSSGSGDSTAKRSKAGSGTSHRTPRWRTTWGFPRWAAWRRRIREIVGRALVDSDRVRLAPWPARTRHRCATTCRRDLFRQGQADPANVEAGGRPDDRGHTWSGSATGSRTSPRTWCSSRPASTGSQTGSIRPRRSGLLFVARVTRARSQMAERSSPPAGPRLDVRSAGHAPGRRQPAGPSGLSGDRHRLVGPHARSRSASTSTSRFDYRDHGLRPGARSVPRSSPVGGVRLHWGFEDPAAHPGRTTSGLRLPRVRDEISARSRRSRSVPDGSRRTKTLHVSRTG